VADEFDEALTRLLAGDDFSEEEKPGDAGSDEDELGDAEKGDTEQGDDDEKNRGGETPV
jgi:hypothetical protein